MTYDKPLLTKIFLSAVTVIEALVGVLANASILLLIARFKSFRTVCNLLLANLAVVAMLKAAIYMPIHLLYTLLEPGLFRGPGFAFLITFLQRVFTLLNLASMLVLLANMYFGIAFNLKYYVWKSKRKAALCCFLVWLTCTALAQLSCLPIQSIDLGDSPVARYRAEIFKEGKHHFIAVALFFLFGGIVFLVLIVCSIRRNRKKVISWQLIFTELFIELSNTVLCFSQSNFQIRVLCFSQSNHQATAKDNEIKFSVLFLGWGLNILLNLA